ncbi:hypothetical protein EV189_1592 [Motilibacter rhizosphaerae]|uniref:Uncharacterized protein n=1 Tax=Motilibacter rhizosphaerae TaxID=598652 RepID=A0A4Q7NRU9_9ACTN|nr:hypothetical protein [Motilibacter rhizosphaerae]RZS89816.1 hypothetical protein EV189_1592 [Motilibacter rhizosphaerae]
MTRRSALWRPRLVARTYAALLPLLALTASPSAYALGNRRYDGDDPGPGISVLAGVAIYIGIPLLVSVVVAVLTFAPGATRGPRYRPGVGWRAAPVWFGGPSAGAAAADDAPRAEGTGGVSAEW